MERNDCAHELQSAICPSSAFTCPSHVLGTDPALLGAGTHLAVVRACGDGGAPLEDTPLLRSSEIMQNANKTVGGPLLTPPPAPGGGIGGDRCHGRGVHPAFRRGPRARAALLGDVHARHQQRDQPCAMVRPSVVRLSVRISNPSIVPTRSSFQSVRVARQGTVISAVS